MKYKILLTGKNESLMDDFFEKMKDLFEPFTTSSREDDMEVHINMMKPDVFVYCMDGETEQDIAAVAKARVKLRQHGGLFVLIGEREECRRFAQASSDTVHLTLETPMLNEAVQMKIYKMAKEKRPLVKKEAAADGWGAIGEDLSALGAIPGQMTAPPAADVREDMLEMPLLSSLGLVARKHILVVDDSPIMLKTIQEYLREDYDVATAVSGKVAMRFLKRRSTDLILLDYEMPEEDGVAVLEQLRANPSTKDIPVVFLTGVSDRGKIQNALKLKPQGYLLKPVERQKLQELLDQILSPMHP